ncbi:hypothetical protein IG195_20560 (plasmid) [Arthrobacter sp. TES]|uniref:hypothetical protein n=1 Tax=Paenarthrobacter ureafaciens TaxID=37931 RepID=UPI00039867EB|nr:hypothetical protein [Paenarthrobacter ureafaciens]AOY74172.1 hypothetical protein ARZXY2_4673 [Arthrobacter sp. ZXY-2]ERI38033.1 hypothetical protein M707_08245 [Arthrobacter sp. AK-YN10]QOI65761.1 hypothetical protein IG195_20560 [Arthrobacter sp. TES]GLU61120.1 hypothetical protein Pure01_36330 [Paenarthrobacter ureafaciens]GLU65389.1 hypothetical protein Pure02_36390 [Paenarthrobacter ureafaciens]
MTLNTGKNAQQPGTWTGDGIQRGARASTVADDLVAAVLGLVIVTAVYFDGRAHILGLPDSFFTPWHGFLYGGLLLLMAWLAVISRAAARRHSLGKVARIPGGYGLAVVGAGLFLAGGVADLVWHQIFGVESGIDALLSPTHLLLFVGGALLLSGPVRAFRLRDDHGSHVRRLPPTLAVAGIAGIAAFALSFLSGFITDYATVAVGHAPEGTDEHNVAEALASAGLASYVLTSLILVVPLVFLVRSRVAGLGTVTGVVGFLALSAAVLVDFRNMGTVLAAVAASALVDVVLFILRRFNAPLRVQELVLASALPLLLWPGQLLATNAVKDVQWSAEMVTGITILSALISYGTVFVLGPASRTGRRNPM